MKNNPAAQDGHASAVGSDVMVSCPFCGGTNLKIRHDGQRWNRNYWVDCDDCNARGPRCYAPHCTSSEAAIKIWNDRAANTTRTDAPRPG